MHARYSRFPLQGRLDDIARAHWARAQAMQVRACAQVSPSSACPPPSLSLLLHAQEEGSDSFPPEELEAAARPISLAAAKAALGRPGHPTVGVAFAGMGGGGDGLADARAYRAATWRTPQPSAAHDSTAASSAEIVAAVASAGSRGRPAPPLPDCGDSGGPWGVDAPGAPLHPDEAAAAVLMDVAVSQLPHAQHRELARQVSSGGEDPNPWVQRARPPAPPLP